MTLSDIFDGAFKLLRANAKAILLIVFAFSAPTAILASWGSRGLFGGQGFFSALSDPSVFADPAAAPDISSMLLIYGAALLDLLLLPFIAGAISVVVASSYLGRDVTAGVALRAALRRSWPLFAAFVLVHIVELFAFVACVLPAFAAMTMYVMVAPAIVVEELGPIEGMRRSWRLAARRFWPVMGVAVLSGFLADILGNMLSFGPMILGAFVGDLEWVFMAIGTILAACVTTPIIAIISTLVYFDARIRTEGFDLQVIAADLSRPGVPA